MVCLIYLLCTDYEMVVVLYPGLNIRPTVAPASKSLASKFPVKLSKSIGDNKLFHKLYTLISHAQLHLHCF